MSVVSWELMTNNIGNENASFSLKCPGHSFFFSDQVPWIFSHPWNQEQYRIKGEKIRKKDRVAYAISKLACSRQVSN